MRAPTRMTPEARGEGFEREGETHMNGNEGNDPGARERRSASGEAPPGEREEGAETEAPGRAGPQGRPHRNHMRNC